MTFEYKTIGFIGLGMMGVPMVENLIEKTPNSTLLSLYDVDEETVKRICEKYHGRATARGNSREVAENSVRKISSQRL